MTSSKRHKKSLNNRCEKIFLISTYVLPVYTVLSDTHPKTTDNELYDLVTDHNFIAPNELCCNSIGIFSALTIRHIIDVPFSKLYQQR